MTFGPRAISVLVAVAVFGAASPLQAQQRWQFRSTPYIWTMGLSGTTDLGAIPIEVDEGIGDVLREMDFALQISQEARRGVLVLGGDLHFAQLTKPLDFPPGDFTTRQVIGSVTAGRRFADRYDLYAGFRYYNVKSESDFVGFPNFGGGGDWVDPLIGARVRVPVGDRINLALRGDVGGFGVGSDLGWMIQPTVTFRLTPSISVLGGYRHLYVDYATGQGAGRYAYKVHHSGPGIGVDIQF